MVLQTVLFKKTQYTPLQAITYLKSKGLRHIYPGKLEPFDTTPHYYRFRQAPPFKSSDGWHYVTIKKDKGIYYVYAHKENF